MRFEAGLFRALHHGAEKDRFELAAIVGEMAVRLARTMPSLRVGLHLVVELATRDQVRLGTEALQRLLHPAA